MVEHPSANPKVRFQAWSHTGVMDYDEAFFMHLTPSQRLWVYIISVPYARKDPIKKKQGATPGILVSRLKERSQWL